MPIKRLSWWPDFLLVAGLVLITVAVWRGWTHGVDEAIREWCDAHRPWPLELLGRGLNFFGQGWLLMYVLTGGLTLLLFYRTRSVKAFLPGVSAFLLTYLTTGPLKIWTHRDAPSSDLPNRVELFNRDAVDYYMGFPSGHVINAIVWWTVISLLVMQLWPQVSPGLLRFLRIGPPIIVLWSTTYLSFHWLTDGLAAICLGLFLDRLLRRVDWAAILPR